MNPCIFEIGQDPDQAEKYEQADRKGIQAYRQNESFPGGKNDQRRIDHQVTDCPDQDSNGVELAGFPPEKQDHSRSAEQNDDQCRKPDADDVRDQGNAGEQNTGIYKGHQIDRHLKLHPAKPDDEFDGRDGKAEYERQNRADNVQAEERHGHDPVQMRENRDRGNSVQNRVDIIKQAKTYGKFSDDFIAFSFVHFQ